jgi:uncharacterized HAD superfamily protein
MVIGWDLDGVLYPWHEIVLEYCISNKFIDPNTTLKRLFNPFNPENFFDNKFTKNFRRNILRNPTFFEKAVINPKTLSVLNEVSKNHKQVYITKREVPDCVVVTKQWVRKLPDGNNCFVLGNGNKRDLIRELQCDLYIEDRVDYAKDIQEVCRVLLLTRPWNEDWKEDGRIDRVENLNHTIFYINKFSEIKSLQGFIP